MEQQEIINYLFKFNQLIRYVAIYTNEQLRYQQREAELEDASDSQTDRFEELLVNPTLLKLASQRGNIDCGGLNHLIIAYGHFNQLIKLIPNGHLSICLDKKADLNQLPDEIFTALNQKFPNLIN